MKAHIKLFSDGKLFHESFADVRGPGDLTRATDKFTAECRLRWQELPQGQLLFEVTKARPV